MYHKALTLNPNEVLRSLPLEKAFHFFIDINDYTGKYAQNLAEFCDMINTINTKSIAFHFERNDFEIWTNKTLHDPTLARRIKKLKSQSKEKLNEEKLRTLIYQITTNRIKELKNRFPDKTHKKQHKSINAKKLKIRNNYKKSDKKTTSLTSQKS
jgi:hypothetical protein